MPHSSVRHVSTPRNRVLSQQRKGAELVEVLAKNNPEVLEAVSPRLLDALAREDEAFLGRLEAFLAHLHATGEKSWKVLRSVSPKQWKLAHQVARLSREKRGSVHSFVEVLLQRQFAFGDPRALPEAERIKARGSVVFRLRYVLCGKDCRGCPHGPYWYAQWRDQTGRDRTRYIGKQLTMKKLDDIVS